MRFAAPLFLHLLWAVPALAILGVLAEWGRRRALARLGDAALLRRLAPGVSTERRGVRMSLVLLALAGFALALARPQWGMKSEPIKRTGVDIFVALDTSLSMITEDVRPSRLAKARLELASFLDRVEGDRVGLIVFAGRAQVVCPLTMDLAAVKALLEVADPASVSDPGTRIADAIEAAIEKFTHREKAYKVLVLLTDGEDQGSEPLQVAARAREEGIVIHAIGIGTPRGEPIPIRDEQNRIVDYKKDADGRVVTSRLDEPVLAEIARTTGGEYYRATGGEGEIERIYRRIAQMEKKEFEEKMRTTYEERYAWPLAAGILFLLAAALVPEGRRVDGMARGERVA